MNLSTIWKLIQAAAAILPTAITIAKTIQAEFPNTAGAAKLELVKNALEKAVAIEDAAVKEFNTFWPTVSILLSAIIQGKKKEAIDGFVPSATAPVTTALPPPV